MSMDQEADGWSGHITVDGVFTTGALQSLMDIHKVCIDEKVCGRRGCGNKTSAKCAGCKAVAYRGRACLKKYAHYMCCSFSSPS